MRWVLETEHEGTCEKNSENEARAGARIYKSKFNGGGDKIMPGRPGKPMNVIDLEGRNHMTKKEKAHRSQQESALITGMGMRERDEVKALPVAHKEFQRVRKLLKKIEKDDALYEGAINRYCLLLAECAESNERKEELRDARARLSDSGEIEAKEVARLEVEYERLLTACDKAIMEKRRMMLDIEKECVMTIAGAMRSIQKKPKDEAEDDPMAQLFKQGG